MAKEDFAAGFLQGLYNAGIGNPDVRRQKDKMNMETAFKQADLDVKQAELGNVQKQDPILQKMNSPSFWSRFLNTDNPQTLNTAYQPDPNAQTGYVGPDGQISEKEIPGGVRLNSNDYKKALLEKGKPREGESNIHIGNDPVTGQPIMVGSKSLTVRKLPGGPILPKGEVPGSYEVPGYSLSDKSRPKIEEVGKFKTSVASFDKFKSGIESLKEKVKTNGSFQVLGEAGAEMKGIATDLKLDLKELYGLGVLNGPDLMLMTRFLDDPDTLNSLFTRESTRLKELDTVLDRIGKGVSSKAKSLGYSPLGGGAANPDQEAIDWAKANPNDQRSKEILKLHGL